MSKWIYRIKPWFPAPLWRAITAPYWWWHNRASHQFTSLYDGRFANSRRLLARFKNLHRGQRCFILGNGPSLNQTDLSLLENEYTFGLNRVYLLFPELGFSTSYFVSINTLVLEQCAADISTLGMPRFLSWRGRKSFQDDDEILFLDTDYTDPPTFSRDIRGRVFEGSTVTYVALQIAYYMGFEEVILVGVDHNFSTTGNPNEVVISNSGDPNHFSPAYFGKGFRWQLPDLEASEAAYTLAREAYSKEGRRILDATIGGKLTVFPKVDYLDLFKGK